MLSVMGLYEDAVLPRAIDLVCGARSFDSLRARALAPARGEVVEIGFGSGTNLPHYPDAVTAVAAVEPVGRARELARSRLASSSIPVTFVGLEGDRIDAVDDSCDTAVSTFTLCTVPDPAATLAELRRILRPGGTLLVVEHGIAPGAAMARTQRAIEPLQRRLAGGCHLTRDPLQMLRSAGFEVIQSKVGYLGARTPWGYLTAATAVSPPR